VAGRLSAIRSVTPDLIASAELEIATAGEGFIEITGEVERFIAQCEAAEGVLLLYLRHTSASLVIQENADPNVRTDLITALQRLAPEEGPWLHQIEGADDMPAHIKAMLTGVSLHVAVRGGQLALGTWQGIYLVEHRRRSHRRQLILQFVGSRKT
jgi:secondary thiamine-phosphate synthase enzyme